MRFRRHQLAWITLACLALTSLAHAQAADAGADELTLELIMSDPDWLGRAPQRPFWADDSGSVYYFQKREGTRLNDLFRVDLEGRVHQVEYAEMGTADIDGGDLSRDLRFKVDEREGDLYLKDLAKGEIRQLTRTAARE